MRIDFNWIQELQQENIELQRRVTMAPYTSFHIGGPASYGAARHRGQTTRLHRARPPGENSIPRLSQASNVLIASAGYPGMIILLRSTGPG
ncbi:MAG: hypothetical protein ACLSFJ_06400 [Holdemania filiformis]